MRIVMENVFVLKYKENIFIKHCGIKLIGIDNVQYVNVLKPYEA